MVRKNPRTRRGWHDAPITRRGPFFFLNTIECVTLSESEGLIGESDSMVVAQIWGRSGREIDARLWRCG
jgi:hypothetical protein